MSKAKTVIVFSLLIFTILSSCASGEVKKPLNDRIESPLSINLNFDDENFITHTPIKSTPSSPLILNTTNEEDATYENIKQEAERIRNTEFETTNARVDKNQLLTEQLDLNTKSISGKKDFYNAIVEYTFIDGKIYDIISSPESVTDIRLEKGEKILGDIAIGDVSSWAIETTESEENGERIVHFLVKAEHESTSTTVIVPTTKRTYYFRLTATNGRAMVGCRFIYPHQTKNRFSPSFEQKNGTSGSETLINASEMDFNYTIYGTFTWTPNLVFSDSKRTIIQFSPSFITSSDAPSLYIKKGNNLGLINYVIKGNLYITDTLISDEETLVLIKNNENVEIQRSYE